MTRNDLVQDASMSGHIASHDTVTIHHPIKHPAHLGICLLSSCERSERKIPMERITLPSFYCPFPSQLNPLAEEVHKHTFNWATTFRLLQKEAAITRFHTSHYARLVARAYPQTGFEELALTNDFLTWIFLLDDHFDDGSIGQQPEQVQLMMNGFLAILGGEQSKTRWPLQGPLASSLQELWGRLLALTTLQWQKRFTRHFRSCFESYRWELRNRAGKNIPHVQMYIEKRQGTGGTRLMMDYIDVMEYEHPAQEQEAGSQWSDQHVL